MKKGIAILFVVVVIFNLLPQYKVHSQVENELREYLKTLTPEIVRKMANEDMKEIYGKDNYFPAKSENGAFNSGLIQQQIEEGIRNPDEFKGFDIVYGGSHGTKIIHKGKEMFRYSGYNIEGDHVSTREFPWDAGWSGTQIHNFRMKENPWKIGKVSPSEFDDFPNNFKKPIPEKLKEYLPKGNFEQQIIKALNKEYAGQPYSKYMYNNQNSTLATKSVYSKDGAPKGGWVKYVHIIQPPTYLSQGMGRIYMTSTYKDIPLAPFIQTEASDISAEFADLPTGALVGEDVTVSVFVRSSFPKSETSTFSWTITRKSDGMPLNHAENQLMFSGAATTASGSLSIATNGKRRLNVSFTMPESDVRIQFKINEDGESPKESILTNNVLDSDPNAVKLLTPQPLPYDLLSKRVQLDLPSNTATLTLPALQDARWVGYATGKLEVTNRTPDLLRLFDVSNNPDVNEPSESITRSPITLFTIKREDFGDDPVNKKWLNLDNPGTPLTKTGEVHYEGSVSRDYEYTYSWSECTGEGEDKVCTTKSRTESGVETANFESNSVKEPYEMYVYNGRKEVPRLTYRDEIEENQNDSLKKNLFWTNEPYMFDVIRWMYDQELNGKKNWRQVPGQYPREFIQQASGVVDWDIESSLSTEYSQSRKAASDKSNKKSLYDKAVFPTDRELQKYDYPIKSGYYFNPAGSYTFTVKTVLFRDQKPVDMTKDHKDLVEGLIHSFRYESDLMYINNNKEAVNVRNEELAKRGGGFERKTGVLSVENNKGVNGEVLVNVLDGSKEPSRFNQEIDEIPYKNTRGGDSHKFWKMILEGYGESYTETSNSYYNYREYVKSGQHIYKITETSTITIVVNPDNKMLYTHANMPDGDYNIKVWFDDTDLTKGNHTYKILNTLKGVEELDSMQITVIGSMFDDLNN
ncbi:hypothetical protein [Fontibacillus sp. BL9]|uniref:hypothetical protein n=1 Tax=Fontibacillus sp. BL9 TaxID=3389971 RepID=UPI00397956DB